MKMLAVALISILLPTTALAAQRVALSCNILAPGKQQVECKNGGFPYTVPAGLHLCVTDVGLVNKYPWEPPRYGNTMHTMYFMITGLSVSAHAPYWHVKTPYPVYPPGTVVQSWVSNGQTEGQYIYGIVSGYLWPDADCATP